MTLLKICILLGAITLTLAEVVDFKQCSDDNVCTIHEVRINPCPKAKDHLACDIHRRRSATISYDFTPHFAAETVEGGLYWEKSPTQDLPLITLDREACKFTPCPIVAGQRQTYEQAVPIESKFPMNAYTIKWTLKAPSGESCCFTTDIKVVR